jgi:hypothetical protein
VLDPYPKGEVFRFLAIQTRPVTRSRIIAAWVM